MNISSIIISAKVSVSSWAIDYLSKLGIVTHFISEEGVYLSSLIPYSRNQTGQTVVAQTISYIENGKRLAIAREMVMGIKQNILRNLRYYARKITVDKEIEKIENYQVSGNTVSSLMGIEGNIWSEYYSTFPKIYRGLDGFKRAFRPPPDPINSMISYGNSLLYSTALTSIITSGLNPSISYLHEPSDRAFSLALDIADVFKPVIVEQVIARIVNNNMAKDTYFAYRDNGCYLNEYGRKLLLSEYRNKLESTLKTRSGRYLSYESIILEECYKLLKGIKGEAKYESYKAVD